MKNLQEVLEHYALKFPEKKAIRFLSRGEDESETLTYLQLQQQAKNFAAKLQASYKVGDKALLIFEASSDVIVAFWGCTYAGIIPVPIPIPTGAKGIENIAHIVQDADIKLIISHELVQTRIHKKFQENNRLKGLNWTLVDQSKSLNIDSFKEQTYSNDHLLLLQYTSGSTSKPKGVKISHHNMISNQEGLKSSFYNDEDSILVSWLPYYHDMGLIGKMIQATYCGGTLVLLPPISFVQKPFRWLKAISTYGGTNSAGPNFAFEDCIRTISEEELDQLDLSSWKVAWNAAEPVHASTIIKFFKKFSRCELDKDCLSVGYGMAEATLAVSVADINSELKLLAIDEDEFKQGNIKVLERLCINSSLEEIEKYKKVVADCGTCIEDHQLKVVDPQSHLLCDNYKVGEVWFGGQSVATGYLNKEELSQETFYAKIKDSDEQTYLRTGDLGFMDEDKTIYIVGRDKDMIIVHGENYAPQDLEFSVFNSHEAFVNSGCAAFSVMSGGEEKVVIVQEIKRTMRKKVDFEQLLLHVKSVLSQEYQLQLFALSFIHQANLPKTTSGKVQRKLSKRLFIDDEFNSLHTWYPQKIDEDQLLSESLNPTKAQDTNSQDQLSYDKLILWLKQWIQKNVPTIDNFEKSNSFSSYGMDSKSTALMAFDLENHIGYELDPTLCWNYPNPDTLTNHLLDQIKTNQLIPLKGN